MRWPPEHPLRSDPALAPWSASAEAICLDGRFVRVLRHVEGRRVASLVETPCGPAVLKVFARPRARGNVRRLRLLASSPARHLVPRPLDVDASGHVSLVSWEAGEVYERVDDGTFVTAAREIGVALRALHESGAELDRTWTYADEIDQLQRRATASSRSAVADLVASTGGLADEPLVPAHRDCHPRQVVVGGAGTRWIDLDDAALAPATLDVGNFIAHLRRDSCLGRRSASRTEAAVGALLDGYGPVPGDLDGWTRLSLVRLAGLAETRHRRIDHASTLLELSRA